MVRLFRNHVIVIAIDKGTDQSLQILEEWENRLPNVHILVDEKRSARRTENLALARNRILRKIRELRRMSSDPMPYMIMMDCDDVCSTPIRLPVLIDALQHESEWDTVSFPSLNSYYDIWALSMKPLLLSYLHFEDPHLSNRKIRIFMHEQLQNKRWIPCLSAFGGFALYRTSIYLECEYDWRLDRNLAFLDASDIQRNEEAIGCKFVGYDSNDEDCEHRYFHFNAVFKKGARSFIHPHNLFGFPGPT
jgi:glycosyltransferase involved in cell wall biosynthesis